jgi:hypothetical protein
MYRRPMVCTGAIRRNAGNAWPEARITAREKMNNVPNYVAAIIGVAGVALTLAVNHGIAAWQKRKRHFGYWSAMSVEASLCQSHAQGFLKDDVKAPLFRLPVAAYENGFPALLEDGAVSADAARAVMLFYGLVEQLNRGLDQAQDATRDDILLEREAGRLRTKAKHLVSPDEQYDEARKIIGQCMNAAEPRSYKWRRKSGFR